MAGRVGFIRRAKEYAFNFRYAILKELSSGMRTLVSMCKSSILFAGVILLFSSPAFGQTKLGLSINGQIVAPVGELESFVYKPGSDIDNDGSIDNAIFEAKTFFGDVRCDQLQRFDVETSRVALELDQVIKAAGVEPDAKYDISGADSIVYNTQTGEISITVAAGADPGCTHNVPVVGIIDGNGMADPGTFWISGFEPLFKVSYSLPPAGEGFRITVKNASKITPFRNITVKFSAPADSTFATALGAVSPGVTSDQWIWSIPLLWPQGAQEDQTVLDVFTISLNQGVSVEDIQSLTRDSYPAIEPVLVTVVNTSTQR